MSSNQSQPGKRATVWRPRQRAHWWLASVLVGCLLPATLAQAEAVRLVERLTQIHLTVPDAIRAESRRVARAAPTRPAHCLQRPRLMACFYRSPARVQPLALDAFSRRGPPLTA